MEEIAKRFTNKHPPCVAGDSMRRLGELLQLGMAGQIVEIAEEAKKNPNTLKTWFGESDIGTPSFIVDAAVTALKEGRTFYSPRRGIPELREQISAYLSCLYDLDIASERITATSSGMNAIMVALQAAECSKGNVVVVTPVWPNIVNAIHAVGAECKQVRLRQGERKWSLDLDELFDAVDEETRAIFLASPGNPTGWICDEPDQIQIISYCERKGIYLISDEVYHRVTYERARAPSFLEVGGYVSPMLMVVNSFSKTWAMSGWRLGWLVHSPEFGGLIGDLNAVNNTGAATFVQHAGVQALRSGEPFVGEFVDYCRRGRDVVHAALGESPLIHSYSAAGGMYSFFSIEGVDDSFEFAKRIASETGVGLAPGSAFGSGNESFFRLCFALESSRLRVGIERMICAINHAMRC